jgi:hypothetical protein
LLQHLATPGLDIRKSLGIVRDEVLTATGDLQEPFVYGSLGGADVFLVPPSLAAAGKSSDIRSHYEFAERVGTAQAWDLFIRTHSDDYYEGLARAHNHAQQCSPDH